MTSYEIYERYLELKSPSQPMFTFAGWLKAGRPKPQRLAKTHGDLQFCPHCGAGIGKYRREGEGTCPKCDPQGVKQ